MPSRRWPRPAQWSDPLSLAGAAQLAHYLELLHKVIEQTQRRVLSGEAVAAQEKICSLFEEHTDIIKKSPRETVFGHKVFVSTGASSLILDCVVERGNPADSNYVQPFLERHRQLYGKVPRPERLGWRFCLGGQPALGQRTGGAGCGLFQKVWP